MGGEDLTEVAVDARGLAGDRWYAVTDADGRLASGKNTRRFRRRDAVFDYRARTRADGSVEVGGPNGWRPLGDDLDAELSRVMGAEVGVAAEAATPHQDAGQVSLVGTATLDWCVERWGVDADPRRLRTNIVVATEEPFVEEHWVGRRLQVGGATLVVDMPIPRCRMIDLAQDGPQAEVRWLSRLAQERDTSLAVYLEVARPGVIRVGDPVVLER